MGKYPCGACSKDVTKAKKSLCCNLCELWFHYDCCENMTEELYTMCGKAYDLYQISLFFCKSCQKATHKLKKSMVDIQEENERLKEKVEVLEKIVDRMDKRMDEMEKKSEKVKENLVDVGKEVTSGMSEAKEEAKKEMKEEMRVMEEKSSNIVLYGVKESEEGDAEKRQEADNEKVKEMAAHVGVDLKGEVSVKWRCGRRSDDPISKPRPMIVKVADDETRENLLGNARKLSGVQGWKRVFISPDLTYAQREEERKEQKKLKEEAERKTEAAKEEGKEEKWIVVGRRGRKRVVMSDGRREGAGAE